MGLFNFVKKNIQKVYDGFTSKISSLFSHQKPDNEFLNELKNLLICADTGVKTTNTIIAKLSEEINSKNIKEMSVVKKKLEKILTEILNKPISCTNDDPKVLLMVGINGSGKTTFVGKFAYKLKQKNKKVLIVAGDTFRAAAQQQLTEWSKRIDVEIFVGKENQDPASIVFDACKKFNEGQFDHLIIDTAGRVQTKVNLMKELEKIRNVIKKVLPNQSTSTWLTIDSMLGQNSLRQAELFHQTTNLNGIVLTKLDSTGKGGIIFSIADLFKLPIVYITFGENINDIKPFDAAEYVNGLLNK
jgi:fused signal recognition particle receptor